MQTHLIPFAELRVRNFLWRALLAVIVTFIITNILFWGESRGNEQTSLSATVIVLLAVPAAIAMTHLDAVRVNNNLVPPAALVLERAAAARV